MLHFKPQLLHFITKKSQYVIQKNRFPQFVNKEIYYEKKYRSLSHCCIDLYDIDDEPTITFYRMDIGNTIIYVKETQPLDTNIEAIVGVAGTSGTSGAFGSLGAQYNNSSSDTLGVLYSYTNSDGWVNTNTLVPIPVDSEVIATTSPDDLDKSTTNYIDSDIQTVSTNSVATASVPVTKIINITSNIMSILNQFSFIFYANSDEDWKMINLGANAAIIDSIYPSTAVLLNNRVMKALLFLVNGESEQHANNNYFYISAKTNIEYAIMIAARIAEYGNLAAAISALSSAGVSASGGLLVFAGTGTIGSPIFIAMEAQAATALAAAGVFTIAGLAAGVVADNAEAAFNNDLNKISDVDAIKDMENAISGISDQEAISSGITDATEAEAKAEKRPTWRQSEKDFAPKYPESDGYQNQASFKKDANGNVVSAYYSENGSIRIDMYKIDHIVEVKNYNITTSTGRSNLINNIRQQYWQRKDFFPNTQQTYCIDVRGQNVSLDTLNQLENLIYNETETIIKIIFKRN